MVFFFTRIDSLAGFYGYAIVFGFGYAGVMTTVLVTVAALTPAGRRASSLGIIVAFAFLGHGLGGYQGGLFYDLTGSYTISYANAAVAGVFNLILLGGLYFTINRRRVVPAC